MIIPPTSVESERVFSDGLFLTKLRSTMSDSILVKLMFLKFVFALTLSLKKENVF